ncbi:dihydrofolate reductase family protein [Humibacter sp. RRB41]|uniref:dihydrofolate reductase family protein n=1 Tax=Humibacter sp. RRB41 TaxID=2919946 RepID=UPI001FAA66F4|nr:dihydrofolate reductase family protein [Humibacter sp. RRB41]
MATITAFESITLDGVVQAPARPDEDSRGAFPYGGWAVPYQDASTAPFSGDGKDAGMLFGHRTYDDVLGYWTFTTDPNPFTARLTNAKKYVVTRDPDARLAFPNSQPLTDEAMVTVAQLKRELDGTLTVLGSGELVRSLLAAALVDTLVLLIHPLVLGTGIRLFGDTRTELDLRRSVTSDTGVVIAEYALQ